MSLFRAHLLSLSACIAASAVGACSKSQPAAAGSAAIGNLGANRAAACPNHAACANDFFIDAVAPSDCAVGAVCTVVLKLVATGGFHINDEYPYRFKAEDTPGVQFAGTDVAGKNVFSKNAGDWRKGGEKEGAMTVRFTPMGAGAKTVAGAFKLSVCSAQNCLLEQKDVRVAIAANEPR